MLISKELAKGINEQIGHEFGASMQYLGIAAHFEKEKLRLLAKLFLDQAAEEREHAMKFVRYLLETSAELRIPEIPAAQHSFDSAEAAVKAALDWEMGVTGQITKLMDIAQAKNDYLSQGFLQWFIDEQLEEIRKMDGMLSVVRRAGERNLLMVEAYLVHDQK